MPRRSSRALTVGRARRRTRRQDREAALVVLTRRDPGRIDVVAAARRSHERSEPSVNESLRTNADDRLPFDPLGRVEGGDGIIEGRDFADICPQSSVTHPLGDLTQLGAIGHDNEVDR
jgi:hypothetical protein